MFNFERRLSICDVGAAIGINADKPEWDGLVEAGLAKVIGFEPDENALLALKKFSSHYEFLPYFIGNGQPQKFHLNSFPETNSLLPSNHEFLKHYAMLGPLMKTKEIIDCETTTLDDALGGRKIDVLKLDVQGAALDVLQGGLETLKNTLFVKCEVEFNPLYEGQPLFAEIDQFMREQGFMLYRFFPLKNLPLLPLDLSGEKLNTFGQVGWTDAIYVPNHDRLPSFPKHDLQLVALFSALCFGYTDLACHLLMRADPETGIDDAGSFLNEAQTLKSIAYSVEGRIHRVNL